MENKQEKIEYVLQCFLDMGATDEQVALEHERLLNDIYLISWLKTCGYYNH